MRAMVAKCLCVYEIIHHDITLPVLLGLTKHIRPVSDGKAKAL